MWLVQPPRFATLTEAQSIVFQEYATQNALDKVKKHEAIKERQDKRDNIGGMQNYNKKRKHNNNQGQRYYEDPSLILDTRDDHSTHDYHSSPHYTNPSIHSPSPSPTVSSQNLSNEQIYTVDPPLPTPSIPDTPQQSRNASGTTNANHSTYVSVIT